MEADNYKTITVETPDGDTDVFILPADEITAAADLQDLYHHACWIHKLAGDAIRDDGLPVADLAPHLADAAIGHIACQVLLRFDQMWEEAGLPNVVYDFEYESLPTTKEEIQDLFDKHTSDAVESAAGEYIRNRFLSERGHVRFLWRHIYARALFAAEREHGDLRSAPGEIEPADLIMKEQHGVPRDDWYAAMELITKTITAEYLESVGFDEWSFEKALDFLRLSISATGSGEGNCVTIKTDNVDGLIAELQHVQSTQAELRYSVYVDRLNTDEPKKVRGNESTEASFLQAGLQAAPLAARGEIKKLTYKSIAPFIGWHEDTVSKYAKLWPASWTQIQAEFRAKKAEKG